MSNTLFECLPLTPTPRWNQDGGIWYVLQGMQCTDAPTPMYLHKPTINSICEPLLGTSVRDASGLISGVRYPSFSDACRIYREGLEVVHVFRDYEDLFTLAMYRRQIADTGILLDMLFIHLALAAGFTPAQWQELLVRMPVDTPIYAACARRSQESPVVLAAE